MTASLVQGEFHKIEGEEISWVGECPWTDAPCFGTDQGKLFMPGRTRDFIGPNADEAFEAINGAAFAGDLVGISTRDNVVVFDRTDGKGTPFDGGAHHIVATASGGFVAPLGVNGLLFVTVGPDRIPSLRTGRLPQTDLDFYRIASLGESGGSEILACAARRSGLLAIPLKGTQAWKPINHPFAQLDLIDVCSLRSTRWPLSAAALSSNGTLLLTRNLLEERPGSLSIAGLTGKAYSLLTAKGHLFVLTGDSMFVLPNLASRFLEGQSLAQPMEIRQMPIKAVDAFLVYDQVYFVLPDEVLSFGIDRLVSTTESMRQPDAARSPSESSFESHWDVQTPIYSDISSETSHPLEFAIAEV
jgi:hypothetical protein